MKAITTNVPVNRMAILLEGNTRKCARCSGERNSSRETLGGVED
jgi:hypothetical protein